jgi:hypothetical protein
MNDAQANDFVNQTSSETPMGSMTRSAKTSGFVYLFLLACMFAASLWCIFSIRSYRSERNDGTEQKETLSLEKMYEKIMAAFDKLGNKVVCQSNGMQSFVCQKQLFGLNNLIGFVSSLKFRF